MEYKNPLNHFMWKRSLIISSVSWGKGSTSFSHSNAEARSWWTKKQSMYEHVLPNLALVLLFVRTEVECGKGPTTLSFITYDSLQYQLMNFYMRKGIIQQTCVLPCVLPCGGGAVTQGCQFIKQILTRGWLLKCMNWIGFATSCSRFPKKAKSSQLLKSCSKRSQKLPKSC